MSSGPALTELLGRRVVVDGAQVFGTDVSAAAILGSGPAAASAEDPHDRVTIAADGLWLLRGVADCHTHLAWHAFDEADRADASGIAASYSTADALAATLRAGVTSARDAGGLDAGEPQTETPPVGPRIHPAPRLQRSGRILGPSDSGQGRGHLTRVVDELADQGVQWIKVMATGGLSAPTESVLEPVFTRDEVHEIGAAAKARGLRVMAHAWGGPAMAWLLEAGVASIEHGIHLTRADADTAAAAGVVFVPTVAVYRETAQASRDGEIPAFIGDRAARAADHHLEAIAIARAAGLAIAVGTDAGTPRQHGANLNEIAALIDAGLTPEEAVDAATVVGARLLWGDQGLLFGDAILLERDPRTTDAYRAGSVAAVLQGGRLVHVADRAAWRLTAPASEPPCPT